VTLTSIRSDDNNNNISPNCFRNSRRVITVEDFCW